MTRHPRILSLLFLLAVSATTALTQANDEPWFPVQSQNPNQIQTIYIDRTGKVALTVPYAAGPFVEGLARVTVDRKMGYIDRTGKLVIGPLDYGVRDFANGLAMVEGGERCTTAESKQKYGYIDRTGTLVIPVTLTRPCNYWGNQFDFTSEGLALTNIRDRWGFIDKGGRLVMEFDDAGQFSEGLAAAKAKGKFGFINSTGNFVIEPKFDQAMPFADGLAAVSVNGRFGFIDKTGTIVIAPQYQEVRSFSEGLASVLVNREKWEWGFIDRSGKMVIPARVNGAGEFSNGLAQFTLDRDTGFIDKTGKVVIEPNFFRAENFHDGLALVMGEEVGRAYIDTAGKVVYKFPAPPAQPRDPNNPFVRIADSTDVAWLERIATSPAAAAELRPGGGLANQGKDLSTAAYVRLGAIGTSESVAAIKRIEDNARKIVPVPPRSMPGDFIHPGWHFSDSAFRPIAQAKAANGVTYAVIVSSLLGDLDLFLMSSKTPADLSSWSRPLLVPQKLYRGIKNPELAANGADGLVFKFVQDPPPARALMEGTFDPGPKSPASGPQVWKLSISEIGRDSDGDGWTDVEEARLGLDSKNNDSDGDGIPDGQDVCPNFSLKDQDPKDEEIQIFQKAIFVTWGLTGSRHLLLVGPEVKRVHVWGYGGPVIYGPDVKSWGKEHQYGAVYASWRIRRRLSDNEVIVEIVDYEGPLAAGGQDVRLKKVNGDWVVVSRRATWVS